MRGLGVAERFAHQRRTFETNVPQCAKQVYGQNTSSPMSWRRVSVMGGDRVEQGNHEWVPVRIGLPPVGT